MKFTIVTPVYNSEKFIAETIESVLSQEGDFEIEYIIMDGGSTDGTVAIVKKYSTLLEEKKYSIRCKGITFSWFSEKDGGMYDAISKGLTRATGDVCAYLNADDKYLPGAFRAVTTIFTAYPEIEWVKGINITLDDGGTVIAQGTCYLYEQEWLKKGIYGRNTYFVQQDSVFWKHSLWKKARPEISSFRLAGDYMIWTAFAKYAPLWSFNRRVSGFRKHAGQLSEVMEPYRKEQDTIAPRGFFLETRVMIFFLLGRFFGLDPKKPVSRALYFLLFPFHKQKWYIDFDADGSPIKKKSLAHLV